MEVTLTDAEHTVLAEAARLATEAVKVANAAAEAARDTEMKARELSVVFRATVETVLHLKGLDPNTHVASYDTDAGKFTLTDPSAAPPTIPAAAPELAQKDVPAPTE